MQIVKGILMITKTKTIEKNRINEILSLHDEISRYLRLSLDKAIKIGELLIEQKKLTKHGEFTTWVSDNLPFTERTARNYMNLYRKRDLLKTETISVLSEAYNLLKKPNVNYSDIIENIDKLDQFQILIESRIKKDNEWIGEQKLKIDKMGLPELSKLIEKADQMQNAWAEITLRIQRKIGKILNETN